VSFILDALRKSERHRRAQGTPDLDSVADIPAPAGGRRRLSPAFGILGLTLIIGLVLLAVWQQDRLGLWQAADRQIASTPTPELSPNGVPESTGAVETPPAVADLDRLTQPREVVVRDPDEIERRMRELISGDSDELGPRNPSSTQTVPGSRGRDDPPRIVSSTSAPAPRRTQAPPADKQQAERLLQRYTSSVDEATDDSTQVAQKSAPQAANKGSDSRAVTAVENPAADEATKPAPEGPGWSPTAAEYLRLWELPLAIRRSLPELHLNIHVYADRAADRFVLVNGQRFTVGEDLASGARLVEIRREGAIVDFRDYRFLLEP